MKLFGGYTGECFHKTDRVLLIIVLNPITDFAVIEYNLGKRLSNISLAGGVILLPKVPENSNFLATR